MNSNANNTRAQGEKTPVSQLVPAVPAFMVVLVLCVFTALVFTGMDVQTAGITVGIGGLLGIELVRRLMQILPKRR
ncbi:hypothetical protein HYE82_35270 [Streptomyces sp. BR123]|uniref:hypothetical protein n=1 Tax=Streptomyces sp. BR123 TaxID=2749828 RepID=UPI0015C494D8|nr:hypothetical protein [Streptomyces sp. BR123]NXY99544.1 hypothetical protein [Streptomyces sp. BR123]